MNNSKKRNKYECEICCSFNYYNVEDTDGERIKNNKNTLWIGYKY